MPHDFSVRHYKNVRRMRLAIDKPGRLHQSFRLAPSTAGTFAARRGQRTVDGLAGCLAGAGVTGGWLSVVQGGRQGERVPSVEKAL